MSELRIDLAAVLQTFRASRAHLADQPSAPRRRTLEPPPRPAPAVPTYAPQEPVKRRRSCEVKAERIQRDAARVALTMPHLVASRWHAPTIVEVATLDDITPLAAEHNARLKRAYQERLRYTRRKKAAIKSGAGPKGWRSRQLRRKEEGQKNPA